MVIYSQLSIAKSVKVAIYNQLPLATKRLNGYLQSTVNSDFNGFCDLQINQIFTMMLLNTR